MVSPDELMARATLFFDVHIDRDLAELILELSRSLPIEPEHLLSATLARHLAQDREADAELVHEVAAEKRATVTATRRSGHETPPSPVIAAVAAGEIDQLRSLIAAGAELEATSETHGGRSALGLAVLRGDRRAVDALLAAGADPNHGAFSASPIHDAMCLEDAHCLRLLLAAGADPNATAEEEITPVMCFEGDHDLEKVTILLDAGADAAWIDKIGETALSRAKTLGASRIAAELKRRLD